VQCSMDAYTYRAKASSRGKKGEDEKKGSAFRREGKEDGRIFRGYSGRWERRWDESLQQKRGTTLPPEKELGILGQHVLGATEGGAQPIGKLAQSLNVGWRVKKKKKSSKKTREKAEGGPSVPPGKNSGKKKCKLKTKKFASSSRSH